MGRERWLLAHARHRGSTVLRSQFGLRQARTAIARLGFPASDFLQIFFERLHALSSFCFEAQFDFCRQLNVDGHKCSLAQLGF